MKNSKLKIDQLKVSSFVTNFSEAKTETVKGGFYTDYPKCPNGRSVLACGPVQ